MTPDEKFCESCGIPLSAPQAKGPSDTYCVYCTDDQGNLHAWDDMLAGTAGFLDSWQKVGPEEARKRAFRYLTAMPAWAHKADPQ
ncbi:zinc ribbon domain-containing protein [Entomohabitans teleogrylli]|uniref:zinc ribbon domain-containing protein n=1 Tax=Entomohabitans teleogrylli TaxID=1384589 RepID=UPI00073DA159|nr:zinc ribbon domain-containing protein [Entomohabitans teleogrylli]